MKRLKNKAGFTLAELLIVVAIIAILVAIGVPAFSTAMERSRETVDLTTIRGAYAEFMAETMGSTRYNTAYYPITVKQRTAGWIVDVAGFEENISGGLPDLTSDKTFVEFTFDGVRGDKPVCKFVTSVTSGDAIGTTGAYKSTKSGS